MSAQQFSYDDFDRCRHDEGIWYLEDEEFPREFIEDEAEWPTPFTAWVEESFVRRRVCPYCGSRMRGATYGYDDRRSCFFIKVKGSTRTWRGTSDWGLDFAEVRSCGRCGFWQQYGLFENRGTHGFAEMAVLDRFEPSFPEGAESELAQHLRRNPDLWHEMSPRGMERFVAEVFRANYADAEVIHVGGPHDLGVDVLFVDSEGTRRLIQVKRRSSPLATEGFSTVQSLLGALLIGGSLHGIVVSTAHHFSHQARQHASQIAARGYTVELNDRGVLDRMLSPLVPKSPPLGLFESLPKERQEYLMEGWMRRSVAPDGDRPWCSTALPSQLPGMEGR